jgi:hypothetical protein
MGNESGTSITDWFSAALSSAVDTDNGTADSFLLSKEDHQRSESDSASQIQDNIQKKGDDN